MAGLRELLDTELDVVGGGAIAVYRSAPTQGCGGGEIKLVEAIIIDILKLLEPNNRQQVHAL